MSETDMPGRKSRWESAKESTLAITRRICQLDPDGITVFVFSGSHQRYDHVRDDSTVKRIFQENEPFGGTNLYPVLREAMGDYLGRKARGQTAANGATILVITDGKPNNQMAVRDKIIQATQYLTHPHELAISFIQFGHDRGAREFLKFLDDNLVSAGARYDIVDTLTMTEIEQSNKTLSEILMSAIFD